MSWPVNLAALTGVIIFGGSAIATKVAVSATGAIAVSVLRTIIGGLVAGGIASLVLGKKKS